MNPMAMVMTNLATIKLAMTEKLSFHIAAAALLVAMLAGCAAPGGSADDGAGRLLVAPGKFMLYTCPQMAERATAIIEREQELQGLMAKAGPNGGLISAVAYQPEYAQLRGEMNELRKAAAEKNCKFVPGAESLPARTSDTVVR